MIELLKAVLILLVVFVYMFLGMVMDVIVSDTEEPDIINVILWLPLLLIAIIYWLLTNCGYLVLSAVNGIYQSIRNFLRKE